MTRRPGAFVVLESLEGRLCPATFQYETTAQYLNITPEIGDLAAPANSGALNFGVSVALLGDLDGDGVPDFAVGADGVPGSGGVTPVPGQVFLFSGKSRSVIRTLSDGAVGFGKALANLGDVNGDGVPDLAVGSPARAGGSGVTGAVAAYSGADGVLVWQLEGDGPDGELGRALATLRDLNNDGVRDLVVGGRVGPRGEARLVSAASGSVILTLSEGATNSSFGSSVVALNSIGFALAVAVGAPDEGDGAVYLYDSAGAQTKRLAGGYAASRFGAALATFASDDGVLSAFLAVGSPDAQLPDDGVYFGATGLVNLYSIGPASASFSTSLHGTTPGEHFGAFLADVGDFNDDGLSDLGVGVPGVSGPGSTRVYVLRNDSRGNRYFASAGVPWPTAGPLVGVGDIDANSFPDVLIGGVNSGVYSGAYARLGPSVQTSGGSADGSWLWRNPTERETGFLVKNGKVLGWDSLAGLSATDVIFGISDNGTVAVVTSSKGGLVYIRDGQRLTIDQAITSIVGGGVDTSALVPYKVGPGGHILFNVTHPTIREASAAWMLEPDGTLRLLWNGAAADVNVSGAVVGTRYLPNGGGEPVVYSGGVVSTVSGVGGLQAINASGDMAGWAGSDEVVLVHNGVVTVLGHVNDILPGAHGPASLYYVTHLDDAGRLIGNAVFAEGSYAIYYDAPSGLIPLHLYSLGVPWSLPALLGIDAAGVLFGPSYALAPVDPRTAFVARDTQTRVVIGSDGRAEIVVTNRYSSSVVFSLDAGTGQWRGRDARTGYLVAKTEQDFVSWVDPRDGLTYVVFITDHYGSTPPQTAMLRDALGTLGPPGVWSMNANGQGYNPFVGALTSFTSTDGLVHIAGRSSDNHLVTMSRNNVDMADVNAWTYADITKDHLQFQGFATPAWVGTPVAYVTPWNALNIAGLNSAGEVEVVWIAPGMTLWRADNLSTIAGAPALFGGITAFTTPWGGIDVVGATSTGDVTALWWAPALGGQWVTSSLSDAAGSSIKLRTDTLTSYVTPWGGLNIAGIDGAGGVTIFWWTVTTNAWIASTVTPDLSPVPFPAGPLSSGVNSSGEVHIGGVSTLGDVIDLSWMPGGSWTLTDVTASAV